MRRLAEFPRVGISNNGGLPYGIPPFAETNPQGMAGGVEFVAAQSNWRDRVRFGRMLPMGVRSSHLPYENSGLLNRFRL
jgi:hypothetical protein